MELWSKEWLDDIVAEHELVLFMKGSPEEPQCGFSNRAAQVLNSFGVNFAAINVLADQRAIPLICEWADFPTMPQVYVHGELIGGSDIVLEMYDSGELKEMYDAGRQSS